MIQIHSRSAYLGTIYFMAVAGGLQISQATNLCISKGNIKLRGPEDTKTFKATIKALNEGVELFFGTKIALRKKMIKIIQKGTKLIF